MYTQAVQEYLRAIYQLMSQSTGDERVTTSQLAGWLAVRPASVTAMLQRMAAADPSLVDYHKSHGARLTAEGERTALGVIRNHRLLETYLHEKLGYEWDEVHEEAKRLDHVVSVELADKLSAAMGHPTQDPHGHVIPSAELVIDETATMALTYLKPGQTGVVRHVRDEDALLLRQLGQLGIKPGTAITAIGWDTPGQRICLSINGGQTVALNTNVTDCIFLNA